MFLPSQSKMGTHPCASANNIQVYVSKPLACDMYKNFTKINNKINKATLQVTANTDVALNLLLEGRPIILL